MGLFHYKTILEELANTKIKAPLFGTSQSWNPLLHPKRCYRVIPFKISISNGFTTETIHLWVCRLLCTVNKQLKVLTFQEIEKKYFWNGYFRYFDLNHPVVLLLISTSRDSTWKATVLEKTQHCIKTCQGVFAESWHAAACGEFLWISNEEALCFRKIASFITEFRIT